MRGLRPVWVVVLHLACGAAHAVEEVDLQAAQQGDVTAQMHLAAVYAYGLGDTPRNDAKALFWYRKAAALGEPMAQFRLGMMLAEGAPGVTRDGREAVRWLRRVAVRNMPVDAMAVDIVGWAQLKLGFLHQGGGGVEADPAQSVTWLRMAAARGYAVAQLQLGRMEMAGGGDKVVALKWFKMAANQGNAEAFGVVTALEKQLDAAQVAAASALAEQPLPLVRPPVSRQP